MYVSRRALFILRNTWLFDDRYYYIHVCFTESFEDPSATSWIQLAEDEVNNNDSNNADDPLRQRQKKREAEEADKVEVAPGVTVASLRRFRTALIGPTQGLPKRRRLCR